MSDTKNPNALSQRSNKNSFTQSRHSIGDKNGFKFQNKQIQDIDEMHKNIQMAKQDNDEYKGILGMINQKQKDRADNLLKQAKEFEAYQKAIKNQDEDDDDLVGRSVTQEIDYQDMNKAQKQIKVQNRMNILDQKLKMQNKNLSKFDEVASQISKRSGIMSVRSRLSRQQVPQIETSPSFHSKLSQPASMRSQYSKKFFSPRLSKTKDIDSLINTPQIQKPQIQKPDLQSSAHKVMKTLQSLPSSDVERLQTLFDLLLDDADMQDCLNGHRISIGLDPVDFSNIRQRDDLDAQNVTFEQLLDSINKMRIGVPQPKNGNYVDQLEKEYHTVQVKAEQGYAQDEGVNSMVYDPNHNYLKDMQTQQLRKIYPVIQQTSQEFDNCQIPASPYTQKLNGSQMSDTRQSMKSSKSTEKPSVKGYMLSPAGLRAPIPFKTTLGDEIPMLIQQMQANGDSNENIKLAIQNLKIQSIEKYGNRSKVGLQLQSQNRELLEQRVIKKELTSRKNKLRHASDFNRAQIRQNELNNMKGQFLRKEQLSQTGSNQTQQSDFSQWSTTNKEFFSPKSIQEVNLQRQNFKKRTPFTQWSNAYFGNGVFFNPPVTGI